MSVYSAIRTNETQSDIDDALRRDHFKIEMDVTPLIDSVALVLLMDRFKNITDDDSYVLVHSTVFCWDDEHMTIVDPEMAELWRIVSEDPDDLRAAQASVTFYERASRPFEVQFHKPKFGATIIWNRRQRIALMTPEEEKTEPFCDLYAASIKPDGGIVGSDEPWKRLP